MSKLKFISDDEFHKQMDANPSAVYKVDMFIGGAWHRTGIFSTKKHAEQWCNLPEYDCATAVVVPYIIDEPNFGNEVPQ